MSKEEKHLKLQSAKEIKQAPLNKNEDIYKIKGKKSKRTVKKSKHKHIYEECLLESQDTVCRAEYCIICGKVGNEYIFETVPYNDKLNRMLNSDEIKEKYKHLKTFKVNDIFYIKEVKL